MRVVNDDGEILSRLNCFCASRNPAQFSEGTRYSRGRNAELAREGCRRERVFERKFARQIHGNVGSVKIEMAAGSGGTCRRSACFTGVPRRASRKGKGKRALHGKRQITRAFFDVRISHDDAGTLARAYKFAPDFKLCIRVFFIGTVRFNMLRRDVRENKRVQINKAVAVLGGALRSHFKDCDSAFFPHGIGKKYLNKKSAGHRHTQKIWLRFLGCFYSY